MMAPQLRLHPLRRALGASMVLACALIAPRHSLGAAVFADGTAPPPANVAAAAAPADSGGRATAPRDGAHALPSGLELLHIVPPGQPPLDVLDFDNVDRLKDQFNAASDRVRVVLMLSPT
jgi:hypothetical protein